MPLKNETDCGLQISLFFKTEIQYSLHKRLRAAWSFYKKLPDLLMVYVQLVHASNKQCTNP